MPESGLAGEKEEASPEASADATKGTLAGRVVDPAGQSVEGAYLRIAWGLDVHAEHGEWRIEGVPPGPTTIFAGAPGHLPTKLAVRVRAAETVRIDVVLTPGGLPIGGVVMSEIGRPIEGARVTVRPAHDDWWFLQNVRRPVTGPDGGFRFEGFPEGRYFVSARAPLHTSMHLRDVAAGHTDLLFTLKAAGEIAVVVVPLAGGRPLKAPRLQLRLTHEESGELEDDTITDELSKRFEGVLPGRYRVFARVVGVGMGEVKKIEVRAGETTRVVIDLAEGGVIEGTVVSAVTGEAVVGAIVATIEMDFPIPVLDLLDEDIAYVNQGVTARTNDFGYYRLVGLLPGKYSIAARAPLHRPLVRDDLSVPGDGVIAPLRLEPGGALEVRVIDADGGPVRDMGVVVSLDDLGLFEGATDDRGIARIEGLPPGQRRVRTAAKGKHAVVVANVVAGKTTVVEVRFPKGGATLTGRVTQAGRGLPDRRVQVEVKLTAGLFWFRTRTVPDGTYRIDSLPVGPARLSVSDHRNHRALSREVELTTGENLEDLAIPGGAFRLRVVDAEQGGPIEGATAQVVRSQGDTRPVHTNWTDADGRVEFNGIKRGLTVVFVVHENFAPSRLILNAANDAEEIEVRLVRGHLLRVRVVDGDGQAVREVRISLSVLYDTYELADLTQVFDFTGHRTGRTAYRLWRGKYTLEVRHPDFETQKEEIAVAMDREVTVTLRRK